MFKKLRELRPSNETTNKLRRGKRELLATGPKSTATKVIHKMIEKHFADSFAPSFYCDGIREKIKDRERIITHLATQLEQHMTDYSWYQGASDKNKEIFKDVLAENLLTMINGMQNAPALSACPSPFENCGIMTNSRFHRTQPLDIEATSLSFPPAFLNADLSEQIKAAEQRASVNVPPSVTVKTLEL